VHICIFNTIKMELIYFYLYMLFLWTEEIKTEGYKMNMGNLVHFYMM
jgi:hypothetical protein